MESAKNTELRVGLFVFFGGVLALLTVFFIGGQQSVFSRKYELHAHFESGSGLRPGANVVLAGVPVGQVERIDLPEKVDERNVTVVLTVDREQQARIRADSVATIMTQGLLGDKYISITLGGEAQAMLEDGSSIISQEEFSFTQVMDKAGVLLDEVIGVSETVNKLLAAGTNEETKGDIAAILHSLRGTLEEIEKGKGAVHSLIYDDEGKTAVRDLVASIQGLKEITDKLKNGDGTVGKLIQDPALYYDLRTLMGRINRNKLYRTVVRETVEQNDKQVLK